MVFKQNMAETYEHRACVFMCKCVCSCANACKHMSAADVLTKDAKLPLLGLQNFGNFPANSHIFLLISMESFQLLKFPQLNFQWNGKFLESFSNFSAPLQP